MSFLLLSQMQRITRMDIFLRSKVGRPNQTQRQNRRPPQPGTGIVNNLPI